MSGEHRYYGYLRGKQGAFPKGYVKTIPSDNRLTKWAFEAEHSDELSFPKNVVLECIEKKDEEWSWATYQGKRGVLPTSYLGKTVEGGGGGGGGRRSGGSNSGTSGSNSSSSSSSNGGGGYVPGSLSSSSYVPGQFSSGPSTEPSYTSSAPSASSSAELSPLERARLLLGGVQQASAAADALTAASAKIAQLQAKYDSPSASSSSSSSSYAPSSNSMKALADFRGEAGDELTFRKGDEIIFVRKHDNDWSIGRHKLSNREGMYPTNFAR